MITPTFDILAIYVPIDLSNIGVCHFFQEGISF